MPLRSHLLLWTCLREVHRRGSSEGCSDRRRYLIAVAVEGVQVDAGSAIHAGVHFGTFQDRLSVCIYDARSRCTVGVDEVGVLVSLIIRSLQITVTEGCLDGGEGRNGLAVALQLALTFS